jgi:hypothetical protein
MAGFGVNRDFPGHLDNRAGAVFRGGLFLRPWQKLFAVAVVSSG